MSHVLVTVQYKHPEFKKIRYGGLVFRFCTLLLNVGGPSEFSMEYAAFHLQFLLLTNSKLCEYRHFHGSESM